jgi:hypothetical protein
VMQAPPRGQIILFSIATCITITTSQPSSNVIYLAALRKIAPIRSSNPPRSWFFRPRPQRRRRPLREQWVSQRCIVFVAGICERPDAASEVVEQVRGGRRDTGEGGAGRASGAGRPCRLARPGSTGVWRWATEQHALWQATSRYRTP